MKTISRTPLFLAKTKSVSTFANKDLLYPDDEEIFQEDGK